MAAKPFTVLKYALGTAPGVYEVRLTRDAQLMQVQQQGGNAVLYAAVPNGVSLGAVRRVRALMTGETCTDHAAQYLGTLMLNGGNFVLHYFELEVSHG